MTERGVLEDRRFFLADDANRLVDRLIVGSLVRISTHTDPDGQTLRMTFPDGTGHRGRGPARRGASRRRSTAGRASVTSWTARGRRRSRRSAARPITLIRCDRPGGTRAGNPTSLVSDGSIAELARHAGTDARRRPAVPDADRARRARSRTRRTRWIGHRIALGEAVLRRHQAGRPLRHHDPGPRHRRTRSRHAPDDHRLPRPARGQARRLRDAGRCRRSRAGSGWATGSRCWLTEAPTMWPGLRTR